MIIKQTSVFAALSLAVAGCAHPASQPATATIVVGGDFSAAEGKAFYLFRAGYTCGGPMGGNARMASWVDKVEVVEGRLVRWGSRCGGEGLPVPDAERRIAHLSPDGQNLMIGESSYRQSHDPVKEAESMP